MASPTTLHIGWLCRMRCGHHEDPRLGGAHQVQGGVPPPPPTVVGCSNTFLVTRGCRTVPRTVKGTRRSSTPSAAVDTPRQLYTIGG